MSIFNLFKRKPQANLFSGGNGDSFENAVVINADDSDVGVQAEYDYIASQCGKPHQDWKPQKQGLRQHEGKPYDVLTIVLSDGQERTFYFDITSFFGK